MPNRQKEHPKTNTLPWASSDRCNKLTFGWKRWKNVGKVKSTNAAWQCTISYLICLKTCWRAMTSRHSRKEEHHRTYRVNSQMFSPFYTCDTQEKHYNWGEFFQNAKESVSDWEKCLCLPLLLPHCHSMCEKMPSMAVQCFSCFKGDSITASWSGCSIFPLGSSVLSAGAE